MNKPQFPYLWLIPPIATGSIFTYQLVKDYLLFGYSLKLVGAILLSLLVVGLPSIIAWLLIGKYKEDLRIFNACTQPSKGTIKTIGLSRHNTGHSNPTFVTVEFKGNERTFTNIPDAWRFELKPDDKTDILYNPSNPSEFIIYQA
jgi:hypothetical protein